MTPATIEDIEAALQCAYQTGRLEVTGEVNLQRARTLKERLDHLESQFDAAPDKRLLRKIKRIRDQVIRACEIGICNEVKLAELMK